eukprot:TRINITY_DN9956_c0_g1_i1.p1 TRINITY_DN9956_c0_g1~~TRINITY_DN9956_c0_g1_i1.p1  ORF type:complete len:342 (+),score=72.75 TRINITY_DN9956_c0_g1_i1:220-1245(+)
MRATLFLAMLGAAHALPAKEGVWATYNVPIQMAWVNASSGAVEKVGTPLSSHVSMPSLGLSTYDVKAKRYYNMVYDGESERTILLGLSTDPQSLGKVVVNVSLPFSLATTSDLGQSIALDTATGDVFVSGQAVSTGHVIVIRVVPGSGDMFRVANVPRDQIVGVTGDVSAFDPKRRLAVMMFGRDVSAQEGVSTTDGFEPQLVIVNVTDGNVTYLPETQNVSFLTVEYDPANDVVVGFGMVQHPDGSGAFRAVVTFDFGSHTWSHTEEVVGWGQMLAGTATLAPYVGGGVLYGLMQKEGADAWYLVGVAVQTGKVHSAVQVSDRQDGHPWALGYNYARAQA